MSRSQGNIEVNPQKVFFAQVQTDCVRVEAGASLGDLYWTFSSSSTSYYVWYNVDAGGTDPAPGGTGIEVAILSTDAASAVATKVVAAIDAVAELVSVIDPRNSERVIVKTKGYAAGVHAAAGDVTGHVFVAVHDGFFHDFGFTDGDLELALDQQLLDVNAHQTGTEIVTSLITGMNVELPLVLKEVSDDQIERLVELTTGGAITPGSGTKLQGYGSGQNFKNVLDDCARLILHPAALDNSDYSEDHVCWLAYPKVDSLTLSGENPQTLSLTFRVFTDNFIPEEINKFAKGDHTQY